MKKNIVQLKRQWKLVEFRYGINNGMLYLDCCFDNSDEMLIKIRNYIDDSLNDMNEEFIYFLDGMVTYNTSRLMDCIYEIEQMYDVVIDMRLLNGKS